jgi:branched-chain amino acid transport system permease protein
MTLARPSALLGVGILVTLVASQGTSEFGATVLVNVAITALAVTGLHVLVHWGGQVSLAQAALMGVGAFVTARMNQDLPLGAAVLLGMAAAVGASLVIGLPALRIRGFALTIVTLAFGVAAIRWLFLQEWLVPAQSGVPIRGERFLGADVLSSRSLLVPIGSITLLVLWLTSALGRSPVGRSLRLVARDEEVAASYGIDVAAHKLLAFLYAGACAGLAGALTAVSIGRVGVAAFPLTKSVLLLSAVLLGGPGSVAGPALAAAGFAAVPLLAHDLGQYVELIGYLSILLTLSTSPAGINGQLADLRRLLSRRHSIRSVTPKGASS